MRPTPVRAIPPPFSHRPVSQQSTDPRHTTIAPEHEGRAGQSGQAGGRGQRAAPHHQLCKLPELLGKVNPGQVYGIATTAIAVELVWSDFGVKYAAMIATFKYVSGGCEFLMPTP